MIYVWEFEKLGKKFTNDLRGTRIRSLCLCMGTRYALRHKAERYFFAKMTF